MSETLADKLRKQINGRSLVAYSILAALVLVFVLFDFKQGVSGVGSIAQVNNAQISILDFQQEEQRVQQYYASLFGGAMDFSSQRQLLQQQAVENLVRQELVAQAAKEEGFVATDAEVRDYIVKDIPIFQENGFFQRDRYSRFLEMNRWSPAQFENKVRKEIAMTRSRRFFETASRPNRTEVAKLMDLKNHKVNVSYVRLNAIELGKKVKVSEAEASQMLQANPEFLKKAEAEFKATQSEYDQKEEVKAQHILLAFKRPQDLGSAQSPTPEDPAAEAAVLQKIKEIEARLKKEDFGKVASEVSEDPGSKIKGGDLGFFTRGRMAKEFEDAAFSLPIGQVSQPIKTQFGYHLIKVNEKKVAHNATWEETKVLVAQKLIGKQRAEESIQKIEAGLKDKDEAGINAQLKLLGLSWEETGLFDLSAESVPKLNGANVSAAVFEATPKNQWVGRLVRESGDQYLLKLKEAKIESSSLDMKAEDLVAQKRSSQNYESWVNAYRKTSKVTINQKILQN
ncbi:MAG: SurA N-terminal domain-containing protein [Bdellovibrionaceae bacterium]|nr:SurA N-terminal domain-containing protein [Pseudobdellovibrionaceae bacterium]